MVVFTSQLGGTHIKLKAQEEYQGKSLKILINKIYQQKIKSIKDIKTKHKVNISIIIPSTNAIHCDNIESNYNEDINYSINVSKVSYNGKSKEVFNAVEIDESTCTWCNCRKLCKESVYSVDLRN